MSQPEKSSTIKTIFRALRYRNFRLFYAGQNISLIGTWMQAIAMSWLVYRITNSAFLLGVVGFSSQIPTFILSPIAGVMADRISRHRILIVTQTLAMIQALVLAVLTLTGVIEVWHIIVLGIFLGCVNAVDIPARQAFIVEMVEKKENLGNAIALNSLMFNSARLVGPSIAGLLIAVTGEGICFLVNAVSFLAVIGSLLAMDRSGFGAPKGSQDHIVENLKEGFKYAFGFLPIRHILFLLSMINLMGASYVVLMPVFAKDILKGGSSTLGFLMASVGVGALVATIYLASRKSVVGLGRMIPIASSIFACGLVIFSVSRTLGLSLVLLAFSGFGFMASTASCNIILQTIVDDDKRGRVMSFYTMAFMGMMPLGSLLAGALATRIGAPNTLILGGAASILVSIFFAVKLPQLKSHIHPIYRKMGIIPEVAGGLGTVSRLTMPPED